LTGVFGERAIESVHLCDYPLGDAHQVDERLLAQMELAREISSLGRSARMTAKLKVRQPLSRVIVVLVDESELGWLEQHAALVRDELNVKEVEFAHRAEQYISYQVQPNFKRLGPRVGKLLPQAKHASRDGGRLLSELQQRGRIELSIDGQTLELDEQDLQITLQARSGWAAAQGPRCVVVLATELTPELIREGLARDIVRIIGDLRKQQGCEFTDRIRVHVTTESDELPQAIEENRAYIQGETLAVALHVGAHGDGQEYEVGGHTIRVRLEVETV
jgi:isoleucyl-tRNA synthetase